MTPSPKTGILVAMLFLATIVGFGQSAQPVDSIKITKQAEEKIKRHTVMERYEPGMIVSADDRKELKRTRMLDYYETRNILDTIDISEWRKKRLLRDLKVNPHSDRLARFMADIQFEDEPEQ